MTLVVNNITPQFTVQVSDMRLTGPSVIEGAPKALLWNQHFAVAFSGIAEFEGIYTLGWLAFKLAGYADQGEERTFELIAEDATAAMRKLPLPKRLAFSFCGWIRISDEPEVGLVPAIIFISNCYDMTMFRPVAMIAESFSIGMTRLPTDVPPPPGYESNDSVELAAGCFRSIGVDLTGNV